MPALSGKTSARPLTVTLSGFSGTTPVVFGALPIRNSYTSANASADVVTSVCALSGK